MNPDVKVGQQWYFYTPSTAYIVYKIEHKRHQYYDGEVVCEDILIYLRSKGNSVITLRPEDFHESKCKLIDGTSAAVPEEIQIIPIQIKSRLEKVDE